MKTLLSIHCCAGLLSLLTTAPLRATDTAPNPERGTTSSGWVSAPDASFNARTYQDANGDLVVQVNNRSLRSLTIQLQTMRGEAVAHVPVNKHQEQLAVTLDIRELTGGDYRILVSTDTGTIARIIRLTVPAFPVRPAPVALVRPVAGP